MKKGSFMHIIYLISAVTIILLLFVIIIQKKNQVVLQEFISSAEKNTQDIKKQLVLRPSENTVIPEAESGEHGQRYKTSDIQNIFYKQNDNEIIFAKLLDQSVDTTNYVPLFVATSETTGAIGQLAPLAIQHATHGIFEATINPSLLTDFQNGLTSTMVQNSQGQIIQHAGFASATPKLLTPLFVFQMTSFVTGQYYFNIIQGKLDNVFGRLDDLKRFAKHDKLAELENIQLQIQKLSKIQHPQVEHLVLEHQLDAEIGKLIRYYINEVRRFNAPLKRDNSSFARKQLDLLEKDLYNDDFGFQIQMLAAAEEMQQTIKMVALYLNCKHTNSEDISERKQYIGEIVNLILQWNPAQTFTNQEGKEITNKYYDEILHLAEKTEPWFEKGKEKRKKFINDLTTFKNNILSIGKFQSPVEFQKKLKSFWNKKYHVLLTTNEQEQPVLWIKKDDAKLD